jgi:NAD+ kinase
MDRRGGEGGMGGKIKTIGIIHHTSKEASLGVARDTVEWLAKKGIEARVLTEEVDESKYPETGSPSEDFACGLDLVLSLGGDGAMLRASAVAYRAEIPVVGINLGKKGFLTAMESDQMYAGLEEILAGRYLLQQRMMLECIPGEDGDGKRYYALNEVAVGKRELQRMIRLEVDINGRYFHYYSGDGVIFSTPTGSTAYSLSAGGPIVDPALDCIILTPICSHSLMDRSVIISPESEIEVMVERERVLPTLSFDGREEIELPRGGKMIIRRAERRLKIIKMANYSFYNLLRDKFDFPEGGK